MVPLARWLGDLLGYLAGELPVVGLVQIEDIVLA
ncbi:hypothetical protein NTG1052_350088 [Candidatus Nitrotoga sp. 1052]|nr:hypothetical protein NTG1052_350088 [Candidatus Nitrotoga sp. 1052]